ncbi:hypothetical protein [Massilia horti]|uniref:Uncharacterized protein n=1 Tax=Massilia horti TaxID=2562153 RepID=A0A4Y9SMH6_9BURK|nr:hypothetical protein [Massilia horti]TFW27758.1 hypothetical protein E4O92_23135 [Massilia horti]
MSEINVSIRFVDGGLQEYAKDLDFLSRLHLLQSQGLAGKRLVHELISDDWGPPPRSVEVWGKDAKGQDFSIQIPYA